MLFDCGVQGTLASGPTIHDIIINHIVSFKL